jgi:hypothetical protein
VTSSAIVLALALFGIAPAAQAPAPVPPLFQRLTGHWLLKGTIDNKPTTHDVDAELVLNRGYLRLHEVSHEKDATGAPAYEAIVFISADAKTGALTCLWLDSTASTGLRPDGLAYGKPDGNTIPFLFNLSSGDVFHTTFIYDPQSDSWRWELDGETNGKREPFARVTLTRR